MTNPLCPYACIANYSHVTLVTWQALFPCLTKYISSLSLGILNFSMHQTLRGWIRHCVADLYPQSFWVSKSSLRICTSHKFLRYSVLLVWDTLREITSYKCWLQHQVKWRETQTNFSKIKNKKELTYSISVQYSS